MCQRAHVCNIGVNALLLRLLLLLWCGGYARSQSSVRLTWSDDCTLAIFDLLYLEMVPPPEGRVVGRPRLPLTILLAGEGTYESPFYLGVALRAGGEWDGLGWVGLGWAGV
jgi:hypothetical protein